MKPKNTSKAEKNHNIPIFDWGVSAIRALGFGQILLPVQVIGQKRLAVLSLCGRQWSFLAFSFYVFLALGIIEDKR
ncbi:membrane protein [Beggiatoa sp. PS]|nr:membrane protein [Beggiatoa sp. PS]